MKKVLIITYYWPPAGGPGVQRWLKFVKYLRDFDIEPIVYIPQNPDYPIIDESLLAEIPKGVTIVQKRIFEPYFLAKIFSKKETSSISSGIIKEAKSQNFLQKLFLYIRGNFFIPDARKFWIKPSVNFLSEYLSENKIDIIITTGPPHSLHLIGLGLKKKLEIKWIADFRDPWTEIGYHKKLKLSALAEAKHIALESEVLTSADHIITTSFTTQKEFQSKTLKPITVITNGYDSIEGNSSELNKKFSIAHIGSLLSGRNPNNLWKVLKELTSESKDFKENLVLNLVGTISNDVLKSIKEHNLEAYLELPGYVSHSEANKIQQTSQILLLVEIDSIETKGIIPGKLFEYIAAKRPILAIGPEDWDVTNILMHTNAGIYFGYQEETSLKEHILSMYKLYKTEQLNVSSVNIEKYSRKNLTGELAKLLTE
ncbi:glycosyltransferase family 4 protein [Gillisia sp. CAL575]|uniref:glycosyltransferase family 4 protein n=1 Tax=Gillisia sp. CAL575 TaxID=985255 RepID=UPI00039A8CD3|nr:glycosyltransferase family 4 protein [Gillisia sp. CAL575]